MQISNVAQSIEPSLTRMLFNMSKEYDDVIDFTLGDPDIIPHSSIRNAGCEAIMKGKTRYSQNAGLLELREAISNYCKTKEKLDYNPQNEVMITVGGMEGLYLTFLATLNPGDEVIIPAPYWINYKQMVQICNATPVIVDSNGDLSLCVGNIKQAITPKTKLIVINNPSNPSGNVVDKDTLCELAKLVMDRDLMLISDEVYKTLIYDGTEYFRIATIEGMREHTIIVNSFSKQFSMTGWRIGYVLAPEVLVSEMCKLQENIAACAPLPSQYAAIEAIRHAEEYSINLYKEFAKRRRALLNGIENIPLISCNVPQGTFYAMVNIKGIGMKSLNFAYKLLKEAHVAVVPGITYGNCCEGFVRIAYTLEIEKIEEGLRRIGSFIDGLKLEQ